MRIAFIVDVFPALSETFILTQISGVIELGHSVDIYALRREDLTKEHPDFERLGLISRTNYSGMPKNLFTRALKGAWMLMTRGFNKPRSLWGALNIFKYGRESANLTLLFQAFSFQQDVDYDILHCHFGLNGNFGAFLKENSITRAKLVVAFHAYDICLRTLVTRKDFYRRVFAQADLCTVDSDFMGDKLASLGCPSRLIVKHPVSLDIEKYPFRTRTIQAGKPVQILSIARLAEMKGLDYSIKAVAKIREKHPNLRYRIAGGGPCREDLVALIHRLGVEDIITLVGWVDQTEAIALYDESHIFVLPSVACEDGNMEGQGLVLQEAQSMGLPVVSTFHGGIPEGVLDGESGFLIPERDVKALADKLSYLIANPEIWPKMGRAGRALVEERFDAKKMNRKLIESYDRLRDG